MVDNQYTFKQQQAVIDEIKTKPIERKTDEYINSVIEELSNTKYGVQGNLTTFRPLVELDYEEGKEVEKQELLTMLRYTSFPHKKKILREVLKDRATAVMKNGSVTIEHK